MTSIKLSRPVANGPEMIGSLTLRKIKLGDTPALMRGATAFATGDLASLGEDVLNILARLSGLPRSIVDEIDEDDLEPVLAGLTAHITAYNSKH
ncbi:phage tail assembly protein [Shinella sp.]|jgi:hypothetical protein|uniref:phage tail assembly protein n=1 Tax=Shinella sp. TaxID=1870904 RepID=UPI0029AB0F13|nr:phage tail assembly protein [Shinella sp.]MDX3976702.1 phage tail assembly protein [Shinella sp.]